MADKEFIFEGKTIDAAVDKAALELGIDRDLISMEVVTAPTKGIFGIGSTPAKIKVFVPDEKPKPKAEPAPQQNTVTTQQIIDLGPEKLTGKKPEHKEKAPAAEKAEKAEKDEIVKIKPDSLTPVDSSDEAAGAAKEFLDGLLSHMCPGENNVVIELGSDGNYYVTISGEKMGVLIGRRGETLDAVQYLVNLYVSKNGGKKVRFILDSENYRAKRVRILQNIAQKAADKAVKYRRNMPLEAMTSYERRIIHATLNGREHISTYSVGSEPHRKVIVKYEK